MESQLLMRDAAYAYLSRVLSRSVLHPSWIQMFDARELSILISGSSTGFNVSDLCEYTVYAGGYTDTRLHSTVGSVLVPAGMCRGRK